MAKELQTRAATGSTVYAIVRSPSAQPWNTLTLAFENWTNGNYAHYVISCTEEGTSGFFSADFPVAITIGGTFAVEFFVQAGGSPSESADTFNAGGQIQWDGSAEAGDISAGNLTSTVYVKDYGNITVSTYDSYLANRIAAVSAAVRQWTNLNFAVANYSEIMDGPGAFEILPSNNPVTAVTDIIVNVQSATPDIIPGADIFIASSGILSVKQSSTHARWFARCPNNIQVDYSAGYATIPADVQDAVAHDVYLEFQLRGQDISMKSERIGSYSYERVVRTGSLSAYAMAKLSGYRQTIV